MSTVEETIAVMNNMTIKEQKQVYTYAVQIMMARKSENPFEPLTRESVIKDLSISDKEFQEGLGVDGKTAIEKLRRQHGYI